MVTQINRFGRLAIERQSHRLAIGRQRCRNEDGDDLDARVIVGSQDAIDSAAAEHSRFFFEMIC